MTRGTNQREKIYVRGTCEGCKTTDALIYENRAGELLCAQCMRRYLRWNPTPQSCDRCGEETSVFRNPAHRKNIYLCLNCHQEDGIKLDIPPHPRSRS